MEHITIDYLKTLERKQPGTMIEYLTHCLAIGGSAQVIWELDSPSDQLGCTGDIEGKGLMADSIEHLKQEFGLDIRHTDLAAPVFTKDGQYCQIRRFYAPPSPPNLTKFYRALVNMGFRDLHVSGATVLATLNASEPAETAAPSQPLIELKPYQNTDAPAQPKVEDFLALEEGESGVSLRAQTLKLLCCGYQLHRYEAIRLMGVLERFYAIIETLRKEWGVSITKRRRRIEVEQGKYEAINVWSLSKQPNLARYYNLLIKKGYRPKSGEPSLWPE